jgi:hypothetical protein
VVRREAHGIQRYVHLGTGNYNDRTARVYTDFGLMTSDPAIGEDASAFFNALSGYSDPPRMKKLVMAPTNLRDRFLKLIERERRRAESGQAAEIRAKMNSLVDEEMIRALYDASRAGVRIRLNVRGICCLRPGVKGVSETIEVVSIVDRFLEHSRVYHFRNGGDEEVYLSSADWMPRNLDRRIELLFPVPTALRGKVLEVLDTMFADNVKARRLAADGTYRRRGACAGRSRGGPSCSSTRRPRRPRSAPAPPPSPSSPSRPRRRRPRPPDRRQLPGGGVAQPRVRARGAHRLPVVLRGFGLAARAGQHVGQVVVADGVARVVAQRLLQLRHRLRRAPQGQERGGQVVPRARIPGMQA